MRREMMKMKTSLMAGVSVYRCAAQNVWKDAFRNEKQNSPQSSLAEETDPAGESDGLLEGILRPNVSFSDFSDERCSQTLIWALS